MRSRPSAPSGRRLPPLPDRPGVAPLRLLGLGLAALIAGWPLACSTARPPAPTPAAPSRISQTLADPSRFCGEPSSAADAEELARAHARLLAGGDPAGLLGQATELAARSAGGSLLLAQLEYAVDPPAARRRLQALVAREGSCAGGWLLLGGILEEAGETVEAALAYLEARALPQAADRLAGVRDAATSELGRRLAEELERGRPDRAEEWLAKLKKLDGGSRSAVVAEMEVARKSADPARELTALRLLAPPAGERELRERWVELEMSNGIPAAAVHLAEESARAAPRDARAVDRLEEMRFRYRLTLLPAAVQSTLALPVLSRGDLAALLYWLVPGIRQTRAAARDIASDVVGHPWREEIIRCVNLDLLSLDPALRSFYPQRAATRGEALSALRAAQSRGVPAPCGQRQSAGGERAAWCAFAVDCSLLSSEEECLAGLPVAGRDLSNWLRRLARETPDRP